MIILSHTTALHCFRHLGAEALSAMPRCGLSDLTEPFDGSERCVERYLALAASTGMDPVPLHLLYSRSCRLPESEVVRAHTMRGSLPGSLVRIADGIYAVSPELLVCQLASWGTVNDLVYLLYELCGTYEHPSNQCRALSERAVFTTRERVAAYVDKRATFSGNAMVRAALGLVRERSASHMETSFAMYLGFPYRRGGLGFPDFKMNAPIAVPAQMAQKCGRSKLTGDLCWLDRKVVFEYDSMQHHDTVAQVARDASKRNVFLQMGYTVVTFAGGQLRDKAEVANVVNALAKALGHRIQPRCGDFENLRRRLEWTVFKDKASIFNGRSNPRSEYFHPKALNAPCAKSTSW